MTPPPLIGPTKFNFAVPGILTSENQVPMLDPNVQILFVDDIAVARKSTMPLLPAAANTTTVSVCGRSTSDIDRFKCTVNHSKPDIVILGQNIDIGATTVLGTDLITEVKQHNEKTVFAIRSANCTARNRLLYVSSGADCVVNKETYWKDVCRILTGLYNAKKSSNRIKEHVIQSPSEPCHFSWIALFPMENVIVLLKC